MTCPACGQKVILAVSTKGSRYYLDANPSPNGRVLLTSASSPMKGTRLALPAAWLSHKHEDLQRLDVNLYRFHFLSCPARRKQREKVAA